MTNLILVGKIKLKFEAQIECFKCRQKQKSGDTVYFVKRDEASRGLQLEARCKLCCLEDGILQNE